jgi:hypothetical protein
MLHAGAMNLASCARFADSVGVNSLDRFQVLSRKCSPLHRLVLSPSLARFTGGRTWFLLKATSTGRPAARAFFVKGERPDRTAEHKKKL